MRDEHNQWIFRGTLFIFIANKIGDEITMAPRRPKIPLQVDNEEDAKKEGEEIIKKIKKIFNYENTNEDETSDFDIVSMKVSMRAEVAYHPYAVTLDPFKL